MHREEIMSTKETYGVSLLLNGRLQSICNLEYANVFTGLVMVMGTLKNVSFRKINRALSCKICSLTDVSKRAHYFHADIPTKLIITNT